MWQICTTITFTQETLTDGDNAIPCCVCTCVPPHPYNPRHTDTPQQRAIGQSPLPSSHMHSVSSEQIHTKPKSTTRNANLGNPCRCLSSAPSPNYASGSSGGSPSCSRTTARPNTERDGSHSFTISTTGSGGEGLGSGGRRRKSARAIGAGGADAYRTWRCWRSSPQARRRTQWAAGAQCPGVAVRGRVV